MLHYDAVAAPEAPSLIVDPLDCDDRLAALLENYLLSCSVR